MTENLNAALSYCDRGWSVLPLHTRTEAGGCSCGRSSCTYVGKHPKTRHGYKDASSDPEAIREWWSRWPDANVGICTGAVSGIIVLDVDPRNAGDVSLAKIVDENGPLPITSEVHTGGGGQHLYFSAPADSEIKKGILADGVDLQAAGAYVVAPPSRHATGDVYLWAEGRSPEDIPPAPLPGWLLDLILSKSNRAPASVADLLKDAGELGPDSPIQDVQQWLRTFAEISTGPEVSVGMELLRAAAIHHLKPVKCIQGPARVVDEALRLGKNSAVGLATEAGEESIPDELRERGIRLLERPDLLRLADLTMEVGGFRGERVNRFVVFLAAVAGHLLDPIHLTVRVRAGRTLWYVRPPASYPKDACSGLRVFQPTRLSFAAE